jgi:hypothetical protein
VKNLLSSAGRTTFLFTTAIHLMAQYYISEIEAINNAPGTATTFMVGDLLCYSLPVFGYSYKHQDSVKLSENVDGVHYYAANLTPIQQMNSGSIPAVQSGLTTRVMVRFH